MAGDVQTDGLSTFFVFWWIAAFVFLILVLIIATICSHLGTPPDDPQ